MQKIIKTLTALALLLVLAMPIYAETVYSEGYFQYTIKDGGAAICGYFGSESTVTVPASIAGYPVSEISAGAFTDGSATTINLPDTIMTVEQNAIGQGTSVVYNSNTDTPTSGGAEQTKPESGANSESNTSSSAAQSSSSAATSQSSSSAATAQGGTTTNTQANTAYEVEEVDIDGDKTTTTITKHDSTSTSVTTTTPQSTASSAATDAAAAPAEKSNTLPIIFAVVAILAIAAVTVGVILWRRR